MKGKENHLKGGSYYHSSNLNGGWFYVHDVVHIAYKNCRYCWDRQENVGLRLLVKK